ncbi:chromate transporter [Massilia sp. TS11]|uniref:chromate transporter n=1 Tax=Massilia sp. TS11 TaxID=2908003 RepID=UPI001EDA7E0F|nr:chromate transporter [Massilia sp. TS11]MCG2584003.1 chromate transporter [Massilia sp. TS11]
MMSPADWFSLFTHFLLLSLMSVGGAISTTADMHRFLVEQHHWLSQAQFSDAIALAQAAPGPNILFVALMGWQVGLNAGGPGLGLFGVLVTMTGIMLPSTYLTYVAASWLQRNREARAVRAFKLGMTPMVIALMLSVAWVLVVAGRDAAHFWPSWLLAAVSAVLVWRTRIHLLWLLAAGALLGALNLV